jgi:Eco57I restriction-modification methylase/MmeI, target recognition domain
LRPMLKAVDAKLEAARLIGDVVVSSFFNADKPKTRIQRLVEIQKAVQSHLGTSDWVDAVAPFAATLSTGGHPVRPLHWGVEFPEVFARESGGFDAIVGNPPFAGKNTIISSNRRNYLPWLQTLHAGAHGNADLVAHFFRRAFGLLRPGGVFGLIATNTIGQGDTRASGLTTILAEGGAISRVTRRLKWPGEAAVTVSVIHMVKGASTGPVLDGSEVQRICAYLVEGDLDTSPAPIAANAQRAFIGSYILGAGFTFDDDEAAKGAATSLEEMRSLVEKNPKNAERISPYIGGEEVNTDPEQRHQRYVINFEDFPLERGANGSRWSSTAQRERDAMLRVGVVPEDFPGFVAADWPDLLSIIEQLVKPSRVSLPPTNSWNKTVSQYWWRWGAWRKQLNIEVKNLDRFLFHPNLSSHLSFCFLPKGTVVGAPHNVLAFSKNGPFATLQSRVHEIWARFFSSTMEDRLRYTPSDCFRTFPFPEGFETDRTLEATGEAYDVFRAKLMINRNEGLTKSYNRFHSRGENSSGIARLRALHAAMDAAVLRAYGWSDLADRAAPDFIEQEVDEGKKPKTRLDWPAEFKDEVLARLLALNAERAAAERAAGISSVPQAEDDEIDEEVDA